MASQKIWELADDCGSDTSEWAVSVAKKYNTYIGAGYLDKEDGDYYNHYMIAGPNRVCGIVTKSEGKSAVFKRGNFGSIIHTPFGNVGVGICYDSRRKHFYDNVSNEELSLILHLQIRINQIKNAVKMASAVWPMLRHSESLLST